MNHNVNLPNKRYMVQREGKKYLSHVVLMLILLLHGFDGASIIPVQLHNPWKVLKQAEEKVLRLIDQFQKQTMERYFVGPGMKLGRNLLPVYFILFLLVTLFIRQLSIFLVLYNCFMLVLI